MGEAEINTRTSQLIIHADFYFYGEAATPELAAAIAADIAAHWNESAAKVFVVRSWLNLHFSIRGFCEPALEPETVWYNDDPRRNYFRIEAFSQTHISFVDGLNSNTGYFKLDNLLNNSTTAAHEYGHTLGLEHPAVLDIRGLGQPGIMYPRGTICDPAFQYDPQAIPGQPGGTLNPFTRKVLPSDIDQLHLARLRFNRQGKAVLGGFSSQYHQQHLPET